jgi:hypothetical protein
MRKSLILLIILSSLFLTFSCSDDSSDTRDAYLKGMVYFKGELDGYIDTEYRDIYNSTIEYYYLYDNQMLLLYFNLMPYGIEPGVYQLHEDYAVAVIGTEEEYEELYGSDDIYIGDTDIKHYRFSEGTITVNGVYFEDDGTKLKYIEGTISCKSKNGELVLHKVKYKQNFTTKCPPKKDPNKKTICDENEESAMIRMMKLSNNSSK